MAIKNLLNEVLSLPLAERLDLYEKLRDNLLNDPQFQPTSDVQERLLDERLDAYEARQLETSPWEEVEARLLASIKNR